MQPDVFVPLANEASLSGIDFLELRVATMVSPIVRIKDGVTLAQVQANLNTIAARLKRQYPKEEEKLGFELSRPGLIGDYGGRAVRGFLAGLMALAGIVLLAACANLGGLFAARTADRTREIAIRMAIGSSRWRVTRQVLVEALVISILGGAGACGLAWMALTSLSAWRPPTPFPVRVFVVPQPSLILMALLISLLAGILFGVMPLRQSSRPILTMLSRAVEANFLPGAAGRCATSCWRHRSRFASSPSQRPLFRCVAWAKR